VCNIIGDIEGKDCIIVDDIIDTAGTLCNVAKALKERGATSIIALATHGVFSGRAMENIDNSVLHAVIVTDTIPRPEHVSKKVRYITVADMLRDVISRCHQGYSLEMYR
jgi:ribose-phosphate pyrophosphokinase